MKSAVTANPWGTCEPRKIIATKLYLSFRFYYLLI